MVVVIGLVVFLLARVSGLQRGMELRNEESRRKSAEEMRSTISILGEGLAREQRAAGNLQAERLERMEKTNAEVQRAMASALATQLNQMENRLKSLETGNEQRLNNMRETMEQRLSRIQADNNERLDEMRKTVDEKLQKTLESKMTQSFQLVNERLEQVYKGLGEMQTLAVGVGDLKKVLSNVKTRGILGEIQLGAILEQILTPEQYETNVLINPRRTNRVEFAVKLPADDGKTVYLPIDSKFPGDTYMKLQDAYESCSPEAVQAAAAELCARMRQSAKDIRDKYIDPPFSTDFAIMFLPTEGLYAEAVNRGMVEVLQKESKVNIAGPSTMAALLNSLQMGFKTLAIQKRSSEVWSVLGAVKNEFEKFGDILTA
ncbi:MAG: DNA recombination protein RmuC, partial [Clostridia bacterium]|nr:DNA recombination protein RmuC [Clostridia bacterium]